MPANSMIVAYAALAGNVGIALTKVAAYLITSSSAMLTEAIHSMVDSGDQALLLFGLSRAARPPDRAHPFGYGMEVYFWAFVVALLIFAAGGTVSIAEGVAKVRHPTPIERAWVNYAVLGVAIVLEGASFTVALREFRKSNRRQSLLRSLRMSKDPTIFTVLLEDGAALVGLLIALAGVAAASLLDWPIADGVASIGIGCLLVLVAVFLARETRSLLIGEAASPEIVDIVRDTFASDPRVVAVPEVRTMHLGPSEILVAVTIDFSDDLTGGDIEAAARALTEAIGAKVPHISHVFLRPVDPRHEPRPSTDAVGAH
jgi:cation diffusion facilitator family transporter